MTRKFFFPRLCGRWLSAVVPPPTWGKPAAPLSTAAVILDAGRSADATHGYPLASRETDAIAAAALRRALLHGA
jgi:hypothetical protein